MNIILALLVINLSAGLAIEVAPGETLNVTASDGAPDVVLLPGLSGCAFGFRNLVPLLEAADLNWAVIEPLAIGASARPENADYSLTTQADRIATVLDRIGKRPVVVLGHGVSASIALRLALRRPDLVLAVVAIEGGPHESAATPKVEQSLKWAKIVAQLGGGRLLRDRFEKDLREASGDDSWVTRYAVRKYFSHANRDLPAAITALRAMSQATEPQTLRDKLADIPCAVLLLNGGADHAGGLSVAEQDLLARGLPDFQTRTVPGAGHFIFEEQPGVVAEALIQLAVTHLAVSTPTGSSSCVQ